LTIESFVKRCNLLNMLRGLPGWVDIAIRLRSRRRISDIVRRYLRYHGYPQWWASEITTKVCRRFPLTDRGLAALIGVNIRRKTAQIAVSTPGISLKRASPFHAGEPLL
jgi:hypothetical protein